MECNELAVADKAETEAPVPQQPKETVKSS